MRTKLILALAMFIALLFGVANAEMIRGLDELPRITAEQIAAFPHSSDTVRLTLMGEPLPYDAMSNTYFIPQSRETGIFEGEIELERREGFEYYVYSDAECDKLEALNRSAGYAVYGVNGESCVSSKLLFTALPVMCVTTRDGELPTEDDGMGELSAFYIEGGALVNRRTLIEINLRGNTSKRHPKKSYRVKLVDGFGDKRNMSFAGLRSDDDWILNPMYSDTSKIREKLAYELWGVINSSGARANSSRMEFIELFINGDYWGLYGLQERVDNKQVSGDKHADVLYKVMTNDRPSVEELLSCESREFCRAFEPQNGDKFDGSVDMLWTPAAAYMSALEGETLTADCVFSTDNIVDYGLWAMLTQAHDCHFKNQFLNCVYDNGVYTIYKLPWDLNNTFGDVWRNAAEDTNYAEYMIGDLVMDGLFKRMLDDGDAALIKSVRSRWAELRAGRLTEAAILERANGMFAEIAGAIDRDSLRWQKSGMGEGNARNILDIESFIKITLPRVDAFVEALDE